MILSGAALLPLTVVLRWDKTYTESSARERTPETLSCRTYPSPGPMGWRLAGAIPIIMSNLRCGS